MYQTMLKFWKANYAFFKQNNLKYLFVSLDCISMLTVSAPKLKGGLLGTTELPFILSTFSASKQWSSQEGHICWMIPT